MKATIISEHVSIIEKDNECLVHSYSVIVDGVEVSQHQTLTTAQNVAAVCQLVYTIATSKRA